MDIHLPKAVHGWREFLKEVGIVVLGVLIALAGEQAVESLHHHEQADAARDAIRGELAFNIARLKSRAATRGCVERRLGEIQHLLGGAEAKEAIRTPSWIGRPQYWTMQTARWDAAAQAGHADLLPPDELAEYGLMYAAMRNLMPEMTAEQGDWARLRALEHLRRLPPQAVFALNDTVQDARYRNWRLNQQTDQLFGQARSLGLRTVKNDYPASQSVCMAMTTLRADAVRQSPFQAGEP